MQLVKLQMKLLLYQLKYVQIFLWIFKFSHAQFHAIQPQIQIPPRTTLPYPTLHHRHKSNLR